MENTYRYKKEVRKKYKKLSNEELIKLYNENKIDELVNSLLPLVINIASKYSMIYDFDELISIGNEGLMKGITKFDINKNATIITACRNYINYAILEYFRDVKNLIRIPGNKVKYVSQETIDSYPKTYNIEDLTNFDYQDESDVYFESNISRQELEDLLMTIPNMKYKKVQVFLDYIFNEKINYTQIGEKNGFTKQRASEISREIIGKIKKNKIILQRIEGLLKIN